MKSSFAPLFFASLLTLPGCTYVSSLRSDVSKQVETLEARQEYGQALEILARVPPSHPEYPRLAQKRIRIEAKAKMYEQATIRRAGELISQNRWTDAQAVYREALETLPDNQALRTDLQEFRRKQRSRIEELKVEQLVGRARFVERALPLQEAIVNTDPGDSKAQNELQRLRSEATKVSNELTRVGLSALETNKLGIAGRTLPIAARLNPNPAAAEGKEQLSVQEAAQLREQRAAQDKAIDRLRQQESDLLLTEFRQAFQSGELRRSRLLMARLQELDGKNPVVIQEHNRLKTQMDSVVKKNMNEGVSLYGRGKFQESVERWNKVLEVEPDNEEARNSLERANRVLQKLRQLRNKQSPEPKAAKSR